MDHHVVQFLLPFSVCVLLPVMIVLIVYYARIKSDNNRARVLIKAIESGNDIDTNRLAESLKRPRRTPIELLNLRLLRGCIFSLMGALFLIGTALAYNYGLTDFEDTWILGSISMAIGVSYLIVWVVSRKQINCTND